MGNVVLSFGAKAARPSSTLLGTRSRRCSNFRFRRAIGDVSGQLRRSLVRLWRGSTRSLKTTRACTKSSATQRNGSCSRRKILLHAGVCGAGDVALARDVRSVEPSPGAGAGGFWSGGCLYRGQEGPLSLFLCGFAALGRLLRQGLSGRDGGSLLRWSCGGVRLFRRRAAIDLVRQHPARGGQGREGRRAPALANVRGTPEPLPVRRPLWQTGQG